MSAVDVPIRFSTRFFRSELWLIFGRRRNWVGMAVLAAVRGSTVRSAASSRRRLSSPDRYGWNAGPSISAPARGSTVAAPAGIGDPSS